MRWAPPGSTRSPGARISPSGPRRRSESRREDLRPAGRDAEALPPSGAFPLTGAEAFSGAGALPLGSTFAFAGGGAFGAGSAFALAAGLGAGFGAVFALGFTAGFGGALGFGGAFFGLFAFAGFVFLAMAYLGSRAVRAGTSRGASASPAGTRTLTWLRSNFA